MSTDLLANDGDCFRCGKPGHWQDHCPLAIPAASPREHLARIDAIVSRWIDGRIATHEKQRLISQENELWKPKEKAK